RLPEQRRDAVVHAAMIPDLGHLGGVVDGARVRERRGRAEDVVDPARAREVVPGQERLAVVEIGAEVGDGGGGGRKGEQGGGGAGNRRLANVRQAMRLAIRRRVVSRDRVMGGEPSWPRKSKRHGSLAAPLQHANTFAIGPVRPPGARAAGLRAANVARGGGGS